MGQPAALDECTAGDVATDDLTVEFLTWGLAGCIDKLTIPLRRQGVVVSWETPHHGLEIPATCAVLLYRAAQEMLANAFRHSQATEVTVRLAAVFHGIRLTVRDNGVGFVPQTNAPHSRNQGYGLRMMSMAVQEARGTISIDTAPGTGTRMSITLPLD